MDRDIAAFSREVTRGRAGMHPTEHSVRVCSIRMSQGSLIKLGLIAHNSRASQVVAWPI